MPEMNDDELSSMLREWKAPQTPREIRQRVLAEAQPARPAPRWRGYATAALGLTVVALLAVLAYQNVQRGSTEWNAFQPVKELKPRVIKSGYGEGK